MNTSEQPTQWSTPPLYEPRPADKLNTMAILLQEPAVETRGHITCFFVMLSKPPGLLITQSSTEKNT